MFAVIVRDGVEKVDAKFLERLTAAATSKRNALTALGMGRRAKPVQSLGEYIAAKATQDAAGGANGDSDGPVVEVERGGAVEG